MKLGITAIIRDSAPWVAEWVAFHSVVGFEKFYIYLHKYSIDSYTIMLLSEVYLHNTNQLSQWLSKSCNRLLLAPQCKAR